MGLWGYKEVLPVELCPLCWERDLNSDNLGIKHGICSPCYCDSLDLFKFKGEDRMRFLKLFERIRDRKRSNKQRHELKEEINIYAIPNTKAAVFPEEVIPEGKVQKRRIVKTADGEYKIQVYGFNNWLMPMFGHKTLEEAKQKLKALEERDKKEPLENTIVEVYEDLT